MLRKRRICAAAAGALLIGCATSGPQTVPAAEYRSRIRELAVGQPIAEAHALLGSDPVRKPRHRDEPFAAPLRAVERVAPDGRRVRVEIYVVDAWRARGCPDVHYRDVPIVYVDGEVASIGWDALEWQWQGYGGSLEELRALQDRFACDDPTRSGGVADERLDEQREPVDADDPHP